MTMCAALQGHSLHALQVWRRPTGRADRVRNASYSKQAERKAPHADKRAGGHDVHSARSRANAVWEQKNSGSTQTYELSSRSAWIHASGYGNMKQKYRT